MFLSKEGLEKTVIRCSYGAVHGFSIQNRKLSALRITILVLFISILFDL
jgi:hypothetical protein